MLPTTVLKYSIESGAGPERAAGGAGGVAAAVVPAACSFLEAQAASMTATAMTPKKRRFILVSPNTTGVDLARTTPLLRESRAPLAGTLLAANRNDARPIGDHFAPY